MIELSTTTMAGIVLFLLFMSPTVAGFFYGVVQEHTSIIDGGEDCNEE